MQRGRVRNLSVGKTCVRHVCLAGLRDVQRVTLWDMAGKEGV